MTQMGDKDTERARWLDDKDVIRLLKAEVERTGGKSGFARLTGLNRNNINQIIGGKRPISKRLMRMLKLRRVYIHE